MKVCPVCRQEYDDEVEVCPDDGEALIGGGEALPDNPSLHEVIAVSPDEATAMVDLEQLQPKIAERLTEREQAEAERAAEEAARRAKEEADADPDSTGTMMAPDLSELNAEDDEDFDPGRDGTAPALPDGGAVFGSQEGGSPFDNRAPTEVLSRSERLAQKKAREKRKGGLVVAAILGVGVLLAGGLGVALWLLFGPASGAVLTVTTTPPGAAVLLDGEAAGEAPLQTRVKPGSHTIELSLDGYEPFKEVVEVPPEGLPFLQPLKALGKPAPAAAADAGPEEGSPADALVAQVEARLEAGELEEALSMVKELLKVAPDDPRSDRLFDEVTRARIAEADEEERERRRARRRGRRGHDRGGEDDPDGEESIASVPAAERKPKSRAAYQEGGRLFKEGRMAAARRQFKRSTLLDPRFALPHRSIARIYQRQGKVRKARYHLQRYLKLGGPDPDFRVRRWLEKNGG